MYLLAAEIVLSATFIRLLPVKLLCDFLQPYPLDVCIAIGVLLFVCPNLYILCVFVSLCWHFLDCFVHVATWSLFICWFKKPVIRFLLKLLPLSVLMISQAELKLHWKLLNGSNVMCFAVTVLDCTDAAAAATLLAQTPMLQSAFSFVFHIHVERLLLLWGLCYIVCICFYTSILILLHLALIRIFG